MQVGELLRENALTQIDVIGKASYLLKNTPKHHEWGQQTNSETHQPFRRSILNVEDSLRCGKGVKPCEIASAVPQMSICAGQQFEISLATQMRPSTVATFRRLSNSRLLLNPLPLSPLFFHYHSIQPVSSGSIAKEVQHREIIDHVSTAAEILQPRCRTQGRYRRPCRFDSPTKASTRLSASISRMISEPSSSLKYC